MSETITLREVTHSKDVRIDRENGVILGVKVVGLQSSNGRRYRREALRLARGLYEGVRVNIDHPQHGGSGARKLADRFGVLKSVVERDDGLYADLHFLRSHPLAEMTAEAAERMPETLGLSHNVEGKVRRENGETIVEEIVRVRSVDVVSDPATSRSLFEQYPENAGTTCRQLLESLPRQSRLSALVQGLLADGLLNEDALLPAPISNPADENASLVSVVQTFLREMAAVEGVSPAALVEQLDRFLERWRMSRQPGEGHRQRSLAADALSRENQAANQSVVEQADRLAASLRMRPRSTDVFRATTSSAAELPTDGRSFARAIR